MPDRSFLDWPFFDDGHRRLAAELDDWAAASVAGLAHGDDVDAASRALVAALGEAGWLGYCVPAAHGGRFDGFDVRSLCIVRETLGNDRRLLLPGIRVSMAEAVAALERVAGDRPRGKISFEVDPTIQAIVDGWPRETRSARAAALGFQADGSMDEIVQAYIEDEL